MVLPVCAHTLFVEKCVQIFPHERWKQWKGALANCPYSPITVYPHKWKTPLDSSKAEPTVGIIILKHENERFLTGFPYCSMVLSNMCKLCSRECESCRTPVTGKISSVLQKCTHFFIASCGEGKRLAIAFLSSVSSNLYNMSFQSKLYVVGETVGIKYVVYHTHWHFGKCQYVWYMLYAHLLIWITYESLVHTAVNHLTSCEWDN